MTISMIDVAIVVMIGIDETTIENQKIVEMDGAVIPTVEVIEIIAIEIAITVSVTARSVLLINAAF